MPNVRRIAAVLLIGGVSCQDGLPPEPMQRQMFDNNIANHLIWTTTGLVQRYIPGAQRGDVNLNVSCKNGGTAAITGTITAAETGVVTRDLTFVLDQCYTVDSVVYNYGVTVRSLTVTGTVTRNADFGSVFLRGFYGTAGTLEINGTLHLVINKITSLDPIISESCAFTATDEPTTTVGTYCGRSFSY